MYQFYLLELEHIDLVVDILEYTERVEGRLERGIEFN
jgi:hypothetical protein